MSKGRDSSDQPRVRGWELVRGALQALPAWRTVQRGALTLALLRPERATSIGGLLEQQARRYPERPALLYEDQCWTYRAFNAWANRVAQVLRARGLGSGDVIGILMPNDPETLAVVAGVVKLGAIAAMLNPQQSGAVLTHSIQSVTPRCIIVADACWDALCSTPYRRHFIDADALLWAGAGKAPEGARSLREAINAALDQNPPQTPKLRAQQPAFYIFTSGTTGMPKAALMSHYRWLTAMAGLGLMSLRLKTTDVFYCCLPLHHNNALSVSWGAAMGAGAALALAPTFSASRFWDEIRAYQATAFCYIGELCRYLLAMPPSPHDRAHRVRVITGNGLRPELWTAFQSRFGIERICEFYGASESNLAFVNGFGLRKTAGFCPLRFAIVEISPEREAPQRDERGFLRRVGKGGVGLLINEVNARRPFEGYTDTTANEAKLLRNVFKPGDCWFNTGDLVRDQGYRHIQFVDRLGDTFRWKGENVATTEVEAVLLQHPGVEEAVVYGVRVPHMEGRAGMASLTWAGPLVFDGAELARHLRDHLPGYAVPRFLRVRTEQPLTVTFKYRKVELQREGFDPAQVPDPLYVLAATEQGYMPLTPARYAAIQSGQLRL